MNTFTKVSAAVALGLALMGATVSSEAAPHSRIAAPAARTIYLGTITVTAADVERAPRAKLPTTAYLGKVKATADDSIQAHAAAQAANRRGEMFLGTVVVTPADSLDAKYAANAAGASGTAYLGTITVTPQNAKPRMIGEMLAALHRFAAAPLFAVAGALVFARLGG